jgi:hypothetical protein
MTDRAEYELFTAAVAEHLDIEAGLKAVVGECVCVHTCAEDPPTACSLSGQWHVHPDDGSGTFGPCPVHPDAPGDR